MNFQLSSEILNTRSVFILIQLLDLLTTLVVFRIGGYEANPMVATLIANLGRTGGLVMSKLIALVLMLGVRKRLWMVNLIYIGVICWNLIVVVSLAMHY